MTPIRLLGLLFSLLLHASFALPFLTWVGSSALEVGAGDDLFLIEQGIAIEGLVKLGEAEVMAEAQDMPLAEASWAQAPIEEVQAVVPAEQPVKPEQETMPAEDRVEVIAAKDGPEQEIETVEDAPPPKDLKPEELTANPPAERPVIEDEPPPELEQPRPKQVMAAQQIEQFAVEEQQSSGEAKEGGDATLRAAYLGRLRMHLERHKVRPEARATGTAVVKFTVDPSGKILSHEITTSSGSKKLDDAAVATIERSAPFPRFPKGISRDPVVVSVPFKFRADR
jgi:protein TonB